MLTTYIDTTELARAIVAYQAITGKAMGDVVQKQARKLAFSLSKRLRKLSPAKGSIRAERLAAMESGDGIRIRESVRRRVKARKNRHRALVRRELSTRESGRGFLGYSVVTQAVIKHAVRRGRSRAPLSMGRFSQQRKADAEVVLSWGTNLSKLSGQAAEGINEAAGQQALAGAVSEVVLDIRRYTNRKLAAAFASARL